MWWEGRGALEPGNSTCKGPVPREGCARSRAALASPWCEMPETLQCKGHEHGLTGWAWGAGLCRTIGWEGREAVPSHACRCRGAG